MTAEIITLADDQRDFFVPDFQVFSLGDAPPPPDDLRNPSVPDIIEVKYEDGVEQIDGFTLIVNNWDTELNQPIYFGHYADGPTRAHPGIFEPGQEFLISMGYKGNLNHMVLGRVTSVDIQFQESGHSRLVVSGMNILDQLRDRQYTWSWPEEGGDPVRDSDVAQSLARPADPENNVPGFGMPVDIDQRSRDNEPEYENIFMNGQYPIVFLMQRARMRGYQVSLTEDYDDRGEPENRLYFGPGEAGDTDVSYVLEWGRSLVSFQPTYGAPTMLWSAKVCGWDRNAKQRIEVTKTLEDLAQDQIPNRDLFGVARASNRQEVVTEPPAQSVRQAERKAIEILTGSCRTLVTATGSCIGLPRLRAGQKVHVLGVGKQFSGEYTVLTTSHVINDQGYRTSFTAHRNGPLPTPPSPAAQEGGT